MRYPYTADQDRAWNKASPDAQMDSPQVSSYWRRRLAHATGRTANAPWVDIGASIEYAEHQRDELLAGELAVRELRRLRDAARALLALKDGPRDAAYASAKEPAWAALRAAVDALDGAS